MEAESPGQVVSDSGSSEASVMIRSSSVAVFTGVFSVYAQQYLDTRCVAALCNRLQTSLWAG